MNLPLIGNRSLQGKLLLLSMIGASLVIHSSPQRLQYWHLDHPAVHTVRMLIFILSVGFLLSRIIEPVYRFFKNSGISVSYPVIVKNSVKIFIFTGLLVFPSVLGIMGVGYAQMSIMPFRIIDTSDQLYQRLLMPVVAFILHFRGPGLYHSMSLVITFCTIFLLQIYFLQKRVRLSIIEYVSICTSSFIITQFQSPGYPETLAYLFLFILLIVELDELQRAAIAALCLCTHEVSLLVLLVIGYVNGSRRDLGWIFLAACIYGLIWIGSFGFDIQKLLAVRSVGTLSTLEWIRQYPWREVWGIVISFKVLWLMIALTPISLSNERGKMLLFILPGIMLTLIAVDTSRMMGYSFVALLYSIVFIKQSNIVSDRTMKLIMTLNICIPAVYIGLNSGAVYFDGLYQLLQYGVFIK